MNLRQLRFISEVVKHDLNVSDTAASLFTSQPGISKQIRQLEAELGVEIFVRTGKQFSRVTPAGKQILEVASEILRKAESIRAIAEEFHDSDKGVLSIATTHTQCRYVLPPVIKRFIKRFPNVSLAMHQGTPLQISRLTCDGTTDFSIATEALELFSELVMLPCYKWNRVILVPANHPLAQMKDLTLEAVAGVPLVTYTYGFTGRSRLDEAFQAKALAPRVVFTATDADVIKTYVRLGLGVGIVARMAYDQEADRDLVALDARHLFRPSITSLAIRKDFFIRGYMYEFIEMFAPHLDRELVRRALSARNPQERQLLFRELVLPEL